MNVLAVLEHAASVGVRLEVDGGDLILVATAGEVPAQLIAEARKAKPDLIALLRSGAQQWDAVDWRTEFRERSAIMEIDGNVSHAIAKARAYEACIFEWLNRNLPPSSPPDRCAACGKGDAPSAAIVPFGTGPHVWLHPTCWCDWHRARMTTAEKALAAMGIGGAALDA